MRACVRVLLLLLLFIVIIIDCMTNCHINFKSSFLGLDTKIYGILYVFVELEEWDR